MPKPEPLTPALPTVKDTIDTAPDDPDADDDGSPVEGAEVGEVKARREPPDTPTPTQQMLIRALLEADAPLTRIVLLERCPGVKPANATTQLSWARKRGWITSERDEAEGADGRFVAYSATEAGREALETAKRRTFTPTGGAKAEFAVYEVRVPLGRAVQVAELDAFFAAPRRTALEDLARHARARHAGQPDMVALCAADLGIPVALAEPLLASVPD